MKFAVGIFLLLSFASARGQEIPQDPVRRFLRTERFQIGGFGDFTTSARLYPAPRDEDPIIRSSYNDFGGFLSFGGDARLILSSSNAIGLTVQPLSMKQVVNNIYGYNTSGEYVGVPVHDGFNLWLFELNGYFSVPIGGDSWDIYLGGGPALYLGKRILEIGNAEASSTLATAFGIQAAAGVAYRFTDHWGIRWEMKFRSPEFNTTSTFNSAYTEYQGARVSLPPPLSAKMNVNGTDFTLGAFYEF